MPSQRSFSTGSTGSFMGGSPGSPDPVELLQAEDVRADLDEREVALPADAGERVHRFLIGVERTRAGLNDLLAERVALAVFELDAVPVLELDEPAIERPRLAV